MWDAICTHAAAAEGKGGKGRKEGRPDLRVEQADDMRHSAGLSRARHTLHLQPAVSAHFRLLRSVRVFQHQAVVLRGETKGDGGGLRRVDVGARRKGGR